MMTKKPLTEKFKDAVISTVEGVKEMIGMK